jgi:hypothetical protein
MFFPLKFSTINTSHRTPFLYTSIPAPTHNVLLSHGLVAIKHKHYCAVLYSQRDKVIVQLNINGAALCWQCLFHTQKAVDGCTTPVTQSQHLTSQYYHQVCRTPIQRNSHPNPNPATDRGMVTLSSSCTWNTHHCTQHFPHAAPQTHITVHNISLLLYLKHTSLYTLRVISKPMNIVINP